MSIQRILLSLSQIFEERAYSCFNAKGERERGGASVAGFRCVAGFREPLYPARANNELSLTKGHVYQVTQVGGGIWGLGSRDDGSHGWFPLSWSNLEGVSASSTSTASTSSSSSADSPKSDTKHVDLPKIPFKVIAIAGYQARNEGEMELEKGKEYNVVSTEPRGLWVATLNAKGKQAWFPYSFTKLVSPNPAPSSPSAPMKSEQASPPSPSLPFIGTALAPYKARNDNELTLEAGSTYEVVKTDPKILWACGFDMKTRKYGWFPYSFVKYHKPVTESTKEPLPPATASNHLNATSFSSSNSSSTHYASEWSSSGSVGAGQSEPKKVSMGFFDTVSDSLTEATPPQPTFAPPPLTILSGSTFGVDLNDVKEEYKIGQGACGQVWKASWFGTDVVVKKLVVSSDFNNVSMISNEISILQNVRHPNLIALMGFDYNNFQVSLIMEFMAKGSLNNLIQDRAVFLSFEDARRMALDVAKGMNFLHNQRPAIVHRDLKSLNVLVSSEGIVKVADFGLGSILTSSTTSVSGGTPQWMAPEVLLNKPSGLPSDIYSFGILMWELSSRKFPYEDLSTSQVRSQVCLQNLRPPIGHHVPKPWASLMQQCWHSDSAARPTFAAVIETLKKMDLPATPIVL